ncbi:MAG: hypothetical protein AAGA85_14345 [Bacteroidota bacterium]
MNYFFTKDQSISIGVWIGYVLVLVSCTTPATLPLTELQAYVLDEDHGLTLSKEAGAMNMQVSWRPNDLLVYQEVGSQSNIEIQKESAQKYEDYVYFSLRLSAHGRDALYGVSQNQQQFSENLRMLSFGMADRVRLIAAPDTIPVADYLYDRDFGLSGTSNLLFVFRKDKLRGKKEVVFQSQEFGLNTGLQNFRFQAKDILNTPRLQELTW